MSDGIFVADENSFVEVNRAVFHILYSEFEP
jgi:hypothetical protein